MKKITLILILWLYFFTLFSQSSFSMKEAVQYLSSPQLEGRKIQTKGDTLTIQYLGNQFKKMGIRPFFSQYEQPFCGRSFFTAQKKEICSKNVIAFVEGTDRKLKEQYILICAHFDHLGKVKNILFPGANDNASGTATVLYLANYFANNPLKRSVIFACFAGEEVGFLGSKNFIDAFPEPLNKIKYVINFDMVGRYEQGGLCIMGTESSKLLEKNVGKKAEKESIKLSKSTPIFFSGSDHYVFYLKNIPFLCFNTGDDNNNYHRPKDEVDSIDFKGMEIVATFAKKIIEELGNDYKNPDFRKIDLNKLKTDNSENTQEMLFVNPQKFGFTFDYITECGNEIEVIKTTKKGEEAGLLVGDKVIKINGKEFQCLIDFWALVKSEKEKPYKITVIRNDAEMEILVN